MLCILTALVFRMRLESTWSDHTQTCIFHTHSYSPVLSPMSGNMLPPMGGAYSYGVANGMSPMGNSNTIVGSPMMTAATSPSYNVKSLPRVASTHADDNWPACRHSMLVRVDFSSVTRAVLMYSPSPPLPLTRWVCRRSPWACSSSSAR